MKRKFFSVVLAVAVLFCALPLGATATDVSSFRYEIIDGEVKIKDYRGQDGNVVIPSEIEGYPVTAIGDGAFQGCTFLTSITIPYGIKNIGELAFDNCKLLTGITIPCSVTNIGYWAFSRCASLTSVVIPDSVINIGGGVFSSCERLSSVQVDKNNTVYYSESNCIIEKETGVLIQGCKNSLIPNGVTSIGDWAFEECTSLTNIVVPDGVASIGFKTFSGCTSLESIEIPDSVISIDNYAFLDCISLTGIEISDSVTRIGHYAFYKCTSLNSIVIPDSVINMGELVFFGCNSMTDIYCEAEIKPEKWNGGWLEGCNATVHWGAKPPVTYGDADGDGEINGLDVTRLMKYFVSVNYADGSCSVELADGADCNGDGVIDGRDVVRLLRYLADFDPTTGTSSVALGK